MPPTPAERTILVAGAGLAGLATALALHRAGIPVEILERSPALQEAGAGIQLSANAGRVLSHLGIAERVAAMASEPDAILVRSGRSGRLLATMPLGGGYAARYGAPYRAIHRADLLAALADAVRAAGIPLHLGCSVVDLAGHRRGVTALTEGEGGGAEQRGAALIGADGVGSTIRRHVPGASPRQPSGRSAWRSILPRESLPEAIDGERVGLWLGQAGHIVHYPVRGGREVNLVAIAADPATAEGWSEPAALGDLMPRFGHWSRAVVDLLAAAPSWRRWSISTVDPRGAWVAGPVALVGDAAHATLPFLAQGGALAFEDALVIAASLAATRDDVPAALAAYQRARRPRAIRVARAAAAVARLYHLPSPTDAVRDVGMKVLGGGRLLNRYRWLHSWAPPDMKTPPGGGVSNDTSGR